jgi:hypothetical protein
MRRGKKDVFWKDESIQEFPKDERLLTKKC